MSRRVGRSIKRLAAAGLLPLALAGCAVIGSAPVLVNEPSLPARCKSSLGSYSLPKTVLSFQITKEVTPPGPPNHRLKDIEPKQVPDNQHMFCLDHLRSPLASDEVRVFKNKIVVEEEDPAKTENEGGIIVPKKRKVTEIKYKSTPYLQLIASRAVDNTAGIVRRFIRTAFILLTNKGSFSGGRSQTLTAFGSTQEVVVADFQVDPFDYREMARVNASIRRFGFCLVLEDYTFNRHAASIDRYCQAPQQTAGSTPPPSAEAIQRLHYLVPKPTAGIFYRPRAAYRISVFTKNDPDGRGPWRATYSKNVAMENIMPIVSVGVGRAAFATRRTGLIFKDGALTNVCISKGSELEGAIQIPLDVIYGIVALPSEMLIAAIDDANTSKALLEAQKNLIEAQNQYVKYLNKEVTEAASGDNKGVAPTPLTLDKPLDPNFAKKPAAFVNDEPPDANPIYNGTDGLSDICAELFVAKSSGTKATPGGNI